MAALLTSSGRPGFYFRVLQEGSVASNMSLAKQRCMHGAVLLDSLARPPTGTLAYATEPSKKEKEVH